MERYSVITQKRPREIVLLRGKGCIYKRCAFCDYYQDSSNDTAANFALNRDALDRVTGRYGELEIINSGSVFELDDATLRYIQDVCRHKKIHTVHFESHYLYRDRIAALRQTFAPVTLKMKLGLETFDFAMREQVWHKGIPERDPAVIAEHFDEANFLFGTEGQTLAGMQNDIVLGLAHFERICISIMCANTSAVQPHKDVIDVFLRALYPQYKDDERVDILIDNTDFGVGA